jgi:hypothetical protein
MNRRRHWSIYAIAALLFIGLAGSLVNSPTQLIIPIIIFGAVFLLWKYPPARWRRTTKHARGYPASQARAKSSKDKRKPIPFKVIQGNKKDEKDSDPPYPFH